VKWEDAVFHHKIFYSKGGKTTVENCQLMHKKCHGEFHKKHGNDFNEPL
jgi:5-methylcytosine-specific restriction endonuclease McrA